MTAEQVQRLKQNEGRILKITCSDGELLEAKICHVDDEHHDVVYDLISSSTPEKYPQGNAAAYVIRWNDIVEFQ